MALLIAQCAGIASWLAAMLAIRVWFGAKAGLAGVLASGCAAILAFSSATRLIFGSDAADADATVAAGIFWAINLLVWLVSLAAFYFFALPKPVHALSRTRKN